jgi:putative transcriptional regulator
LRPLDVGGAGVSLSVWWRERAGVSTGRVCQEREIGSPAGGAQQSLENDGRTAAKLSEWTMSKRAFDKIKAGLESAKAYLDGTGDKRKYRVHVPEKIDVRKIRTRLGLSQETFADTYGFALSAVRDWEQGRRRPERSARILLRIVEREPDAVTRALAS